ncbi:MAG: GpE family phage tail protein [Candidatus Sedimenticola sp. (ex Thyasira tokunagai)]
MANLAAVFHWQPSEMKALEVEELVEYHRLAKERT